MDHIIIISKKLKSKLKITNSLFKNNDNDINKIHKIEKVITAHKNEIFIK